MIVAGLSAYLAGDPEYIPAAQGGNIYHGNMEQTDQAILKAAAAYAVVVGMVFSHRRGVAFTPAARDNTYYENLFIMMGLTDQYTGRPDPLKISCFRKFAVLNS